MEFLVCGAQKSGTTALADYLRGHPELHIPDRKELHFFDDEAVDWSNPDYRVYHQSFGRDRDQRKWGEATPVYMYWNDAPARIWNYNKEMKIVLILRNPVTRAYSHWAMEYRRGNELLSFEDALAEEESRCRSELPLQHRIYSYIDRGFYSCQIRRLWHLFGRDQVLVLKQEELISEPQQCLDKVLRHLVVDPFTINRVLESHKSEYEEVISEKVVVQLESLFQQEIRQLEQMLGWNCSDWLGTCD